MTRQPGCHRCALVGQRVGRFLMSLGRVDGAARAPTWSIVGRCTALAQWRIARVADRITSSARGPVTDRQRAPARRLPRPGPRSGVMRSGRCAAPRRDARAAGRWRTRSRRAPRQQLRSPPVRGDRPVRRCPRIAVGEWFETARPDAVCSSAPVGGMARSDPARRASRPRCAGSGLDADVEGTRAAGSYVLAASGWPARGGWPSRSW